jgi:formylglycine-generating enzyme
MADLADASSLLLPRFPEKWASAWGEDEFGLWMALEYSGARQVFRWMWPGTFLIGSPEAEAERYDTETQHEVTLTQGYWLAETACTQALWQAVMSDNPSDFKDDPRNPVETVSWDDAQRFIGQLNERVSGLNACLPTEAQWEYACRAGTTTAFSFGENITSEQVNYDGNHPYSGGKKGLYRERTVPVGSLPPNAWGLYEMHGNVWEWCEDWFENYASDAQVDPRGPREGALRVLRGGSWFDYGRFVRSAVRSGNGPGDRSGSIGFRLALGQEPGRQEAPAKETRGTRG